jgi:hypothetical protein
MAIYETARWNKNKPALMSYMITKSRMMRRKTGRKNATFIYMVSVVFALSIWTAFFFPSSDLLDSQAIVMIDPQAPAKPGRTKICFVNSVFGTNSHKAMDQPQNVTSLQLENPDYRFYYFTNMEEIVTPGWTKVIMKDLKYQRHITMSRYPKFLGWKYQPIQNECGLVVYLDGYWKPRPLKTVKFRMLLRDLQVHKYGLFQVSHPFGNGLKAEFERIVSGTKDTQEHVDLSLKWLEAQPDFDDNCTLYWNGVFGKWQSFLAYLYGVY